MPIFNFFVVCAEILKPGAIAWNITVEFDKDILHSIHVCSTIASNNKAFVAKIDGRIFVNIQGYQNNG